MPEIFEWNVAANPVSIVINLNRRGCLGTDVPDFARAAGMKGTSCGLVARTGHITLKTDAAQSL